MTTDGRGSWLVWTRRVLAALVLGAVAASPWWVPRTLRPLAFFGVRKVSVVGAHYLAPDALVRWLELRPDASVFDDLVPLRERLERTGAFTDVRIHRRLPATLVVDVAEKEPVALMDAPQGLVALARDGRALPYDLVRAGVDAPIVVTAGVPLLESLARIQATDLGLFADVVSARERGGEVLLDLNQGRLRLDVPVDPDIVRSVSAVRRDLAARGIGWHELDGRFHGWVVVRRRTT